MILKKDDHSNGNIFYMISEFVKQVIQVAQMKGLWKFLIDDSLLNIFPCITDYTDEVNRFSSH